MGDSFLDDLRAISAQVEQDSTITIAVPPSFRVAVRFRSPEGGRDTLSPYIAKYRLGEALDAEDEMQLIVECCDEILRCDPETGATSPYSEGRPLRFDAGDERWGPDDARPKSARGCVAKLYSLDEVPGAAAGTADRLMSWLMGLREQASQRVEGKSEAATPAT